MSPIRLVAAAGVAVVLAAGSAVAVRAATIGSSPSKTQPTRPAVAPQQGSHSKGNCPNMGSSSGNSSNTSYMPDPNL